jgi:hypothetical protein
MSLETGTTISQLISSNPTAGDPFSQGDDHLRLIKSVLKTQFPGAAAGGFNTPITATEAELNFVHGVTSAIQTQLNSISGKLPSGIIVMWSGTVAPTGWRLCNGVGGAPDLRDKFIMAVGTAYTAPGTTGGTPHSAIVLHAHTATSTGTVNLTTGAQSGAHGHPFDTGNENSSHAHSYGGITGSGGIGGGSGSGQGTLTTGNENALHTHSGTTYGENANHVHALSGALTVNTTVNNSGVSGTNANLPPFYVLAFIQLI